MDAEEYEDRIESLGAELREAKDIIEELQTALAGCENAIGEVSRKARNY